MRSFFANPYAWETEHMFAGRNVPRLAQRLLRHVLPYFTTPVWKFCRELRRRRVDMILCQEYEYARFDVLAVPRPPLGRSGFFSLSVGNLQNPPLLKLTPPPSLQHIPQL